MLNKKYILFLIILLINTLFITYVFGKEKDKKLDQNEVSIIFQKFENGMNTGAVKEFSSFFNSETYISLENGISSYFSQNQSYYVLKDFLSIYKPIRFKFIRINESADLPFAVGQFTYSLRGIRGSSQVFVSLKKNGTTWKISQISIN